MTWQIQALEQLAPQIKGLLEIDPGNKIPQLAIAQLIERCSTHVLLPSQMTMPEAQNSKDFLSKSSDYSRSKLASEYRGRLHLVATRIFPAFANFAVSKKAVSVPAPTNDVAILTVLTHLASGKANQLDFQVAENFLTKVVCVDVKNRIPRTPARILTSLDNLQNVNDLQDPEVCLEIAIMCLILQPTGDRFANLVRKFAGLCGIEGDLIVRAVLTAIHSTLKQNEPLELGEVPVIGEKSGPEEEDRFEPILKPWELEPTESVAEGREKVEVEADDVGGGDRSNWFQGDELNEWRTARLCVARFMDRLDPNSFAVLENPEPQTDV
jgi:hypothetical protein